MPRKRKVPRPPGPTAAELDADAETLDRLAEKPGLISGIYNYCDRWCERCAFTERCLSFQMDRARPKGPASGMKAGGSTADAFWGEISRSFALARRLVEREAKKLGIDLDSPGALDDAQREERQRRRLAARQGSALHQAATTYWKAAQGLLERLKPELEAAQESLHTQARLGAGQPQAVVAEIADGLDVVQWYLFFIDVKLQRAVAARVDLIRDGDDGFPSDSDGSAKIALVAIDRSIGAWARLRGHLPGEADAILDLLVQLERLRRAVDREFPRARLFQRPGFDAVG